MIPSTTTTRSESIPRRRRDASGTQDDDTLLRPRNRRIGGLAYAYSAQEQELGHTSSAASTPGASRSASPLPSKHPSRRTGRTAAVGSSSGTGSLLATPLDRESNNGTGSPILGAGANFGSTFSGFGLGKVEGSWMSSWNALQGLASSVLGSTEDGEESTAAGKKRRDIRPRRLPDKWGVPSTKTNAIGEGSTVEREAQVRAKEMARVLEGRDEPIDSMDTSGKFKLRSSIDETRPGSSQDDDFAMVYIHHVQKNDTLQGVVLRYNCKPDVFRKANRFWPNDSIQIRKTVILPVDACAVKGRPCDPPDPDEPNGGVDLLAPTPSIEDPLFMNSGTKSTDWLNNGKSIERIDESENPWVHVRWVLIDSSPSSQPVEIARMPRKTLGYFPPRRRKSQNTLSTVSTPRDSLDFPASTITPSALLPDPTSSSTSRKTSHLSQTQNTSLNSISSYFPPAPMSVSSGTRSRRVSESVSETVDRNRQGWMRGPGGVGTFNVRKPGPGNDGLNSWTRKNLPSIAIDGLPSTSILGAEQAHFGFKNSSSGDDAMAGSGIVRGVGGGSGYEGTETRRELGVGSMGQGMGLENAAAAVEGWVRKLAAAGASSVRVSSVVIGSETGTPRRDLIELIDGAGSDDGRWELALDRERERERGASAGPSSSRVGAGRRAGSPSLGLGLGWGSGGGGGGGSGSAMKAGKGD